MSIFLTKTRSVRSATVKRATDLGGKVEFHRCDVSSKVSVDEVFGMITQGRAIHILVNNAGISHVGNLASF